MKKKITFLSTAKYLFLISMAAVFILPMVFTLRASLKDNRTIFSDPFGLPEVFRFENYITAWREANMSRYFINSILISLGLLNFSGERGSDYGPIVKAARNACFRKALRAACFVFGHRVDGGCRETEFIYSRYCGKCVDFPTAPGL